MSAAILNPIRCLQSPGSQGVTSIEKAELFDHIVPELRLDMLRQETTWTIFEPHMRGELNTAPFDDTLLRNHNAGVGCQLLFQLRGVPDWANGANAETFFALDIDDWISYVANMVQRYKPGGTYPASQGWASTEGVRHWEIFNEPDASGWSPQPSASIYTNVLKVTYQTIKSIDPEAVVVGVCSSIFGGLENIGSASGGHFWAAALYAQGAGPYFDVLSHHIYPGSNTPLSNFTTSRLRNMRRVMSNHGDSKKPVWLTEFGYTTSGAGADVTEAQQAINVNLTYNKLLKESDDVQAIFFSKSIDDPGGAFPAGLVKYDPPTWTRKPAYAVYRDLIPETL